MGFSPLPGLSGLAPGKGQATAGRPTILENSELLVKVCCFVDLACQIKSYYCHLLVDGIFVVANQSLKTNLAKKISPQFKIMVLFTLLFRNGGCIQYQNITKPNNGRPVDVSPSLCIIQPMGRPRKGSFKPQETKIFSLLMVFLRLLGTICFEQIFFI